MNYSINHIHLRSTNPHDSAKWCEKYFGATVISALEVMPGTITVSMDVGGPVRLNISSQPSGSSDENNAAKLNKLGLEHFGFDTDDIQSDIEKFKMGEVRIVPPITEIPGGTRLAYIEEPDQVLIELVQHRRVS